MCIGEVGTVQITTEDRASQHLASTGIMIYTHLSLSLFVCM